MAVLEFECPIEFQHQWGPNCGREMGMKSLKSQIRTNSLNAWLVLSITLAATVGVAVFFESRSASRAQRMFAEESLRQKGMIEERLNQQVNLMHGIAAFMGTVDELSLQQWKSFANYLEQNVGLAPYVEGLGFALIQSSDNEASQVYPKYDRWPVHNLESKSSVIYVSPSIGENDHKLGYDMLYDRVCRDAMLHAVDTGKPMLSGKIKLLGENNEFTPGSVLFVPVYAKDKPIDTVDEKRRSQIGWLFTEINVGAMIADVLSQDSTFADSKLIIYEGLKPSRAGLLYSNVDLDSDLLAEDGYQGFENSLSLFGRDWRQRTQLVGAKDGSGNATLYCCLLGSLIAAVLWYLNFAIDESKVLVGDLRKATQRLYLADQPAKA